MKISMRDIDGVCDDNYVGDNNLDMRTRVIIIGKEVANCRALENLIRCEVHRLLNEIRSIIMTESPFFK